MGFVDQSPVDADRSRGRGLLLIGLLALLRAACLQAEAPRAETVGEPIPLVIEQLSGQSWRLLPGVGVVLAGRLEQARLSAGGVLDMQGADGVSGVGPSLLEQWRRMGIR
ncbi:MAG: DNA uptake protein ComE-like DNA-binding protein [Pseudohongiellaceae bacterium]